MSDSLKIPAGVVVSGSGRVKYPHDYPHYAEVFGRGDTSIRGWVRIGKKKGELPPLDQPAELLLWWRRHMKQRVPDTIERLARVDVHDVEPLVLEQDEISEVELRSPDLADSVFLSIERAGSASDSLNRLRSATKMCYEKYCAALAAGERGEAATWRKDWLEAEEKQRHWEKDITAILQKRGELVSKPDLLGMLAAIGGTLRRNFRACLKTYGRDLVPTMTDDELSNLADPHLEACFARLRESEFAEALQRAS